MELEQLMPEDSSKKAIDTCAIPDLRKSADSRFDLGGGISARFVGRPDGHLGATEDEYDDYRDFYGF
jgi:hypothetical protein